MTNGSLRYGHSILWQSAENTWPLANSWATFCQHFAMQKWRICKLLFLLRKCGYYVRTPGPSWESQPRHSLSCSWPAQPSSVLTPKLWEWPSGGLLVLLIGVSTEHSNPTPLTPHRHCTALEEGLGQREGEIAEALCCLLGEKQTKKNKKVKPGHKNWILN